jgi:hypothetical protein
MIADRAEISWDTEKSKWLVRIEVGAEVIRRYCKEPKNIDEQRLRATAEKTVADEGYQIDSAKVAVRL